MINFLKKLRGLSHVIRWNFHPTLRRENVAEHSYWVAMYAMALSIMSGEMHVETIAVQGLLHDAEESITGDLPALVKRYTNWKPVVDRATEELFDGQGDEYMRFMYTTDIYKDVIKAADLFAALAFANEEAKMGNTYYAIIVKELKGSLLALAGRSPDKLRGAIYELMRGLGYGDGGGIVNPLQMSHF